MKSIQEALVESGVPMPNRHERRSNEARAKAYDKAVKVLGAKAVQAHMAKAVEKLIPEVPGEERVTTEDGISRRAWRVSRIRRTHR